jgi:hypothetical protein
MFLQMWPGSYSLGSLWGLFILFGAAPGQTRGHECPRQVSAGGDDNDDAANDCNDCDADCTQSLGYFGVVLGFGV